MNTRGSLDAREKLIVGDIVTQLTQEYGDLSKQQPRHRAAIYAARLMLIEADYRNQNHLVSVIAQRCGIPHASPDTKSKLATERFPRICAAAGNLLVELKDSPARAISRYATQVDVSTPDATDKDRSRLFMEPLLVRGIDIAPATEATPADLPTYRIGPNKKEFIIPLTGNKPEFEELSWISPYTPRFEWNIYALNNGMQVAERAQLVAQPRETLDSAT